MSIRFWACSLVLAASVSVIAANPESQTPPTSRVKAPEKPTAEGAQGEPESDEANAEDAEARKSAERFLMVLERNPRKGTALDKVVEFHVDHESLADLIARLREKAGAADKGKPDEAGRAWLVVGLVEASQGDAESAQTAFERAEELLPKNAVASYLLGQNLMTLNRWPEAAVALERAIQRQPAPTDLLDVFQTLGRVQQRLAPGDKVVEVWTRLEKLVPNDPRVSELIATTLLDDGHWEAALPRFEALAKATKDLYRRSEFELEAVDLRLKLGQTEQAMTDADRLLGGLKPDHWLFRETRRRVEEAFLAKDDTAGLIKHYEERLVKQPEDLDAVVRLSRALVSSDRRKDARTRLESGIKLAPSSVDLRMELIELLQSEQQFAEAIAQYEQLDRIEPNNPDHIRDWGFLILKQAEGGARGSR
ncbi:MAG: tetratricopeptide repeat protein, partial [Planctomycetaceae bacterium]|nr:tetratricopeptide repeat protein [Planctomycetaceae bacterium]